MKYSSGVQIIATFDDRAVPLTDAPAHATEPQSDVAALVARIESALETVYLALAEIKRLQAPPQGLPQSKAG